MEEGLHKGVSTLKLDCLWIWKGGSPQATQQGSVLPGTPRLPQEPTKGEQPLSYLGYKGSKKRGRQSEFGSLWYLQQGKKRKGSWGIML